MSATSGGGGSVSEGSETGGSSHSTMSVSDSPSTSFQANLPENVTKITLSEENSAVGFGADVTGSKINLSLDDRHQKDGIVNVAFDHEEGANRGSGGGDFRSINGSEKKDRVPEAVNLELVNMVPYSNGNGTSYGVPVNGIPIKKDSEQVDMSSPYDEYFVPVNEHKKYMRGEKLYVTKDKRRPTSWRRCLSWIVAYTVISVVLIVAILAGTGVILSQEPDLIKEASVGRNFAGSNLKPSVTNKFPTPTAEMFVYVPRSIESEFVIDNMDFDPAFKDKNSTTYQQFATDMEDQLKMVLFDKEALEFGASDVALKVVNISRDPFKVNYRIGWNYKQGVNNPQEPIKMEDVKKRLVESLTRNHGYIDKYHIDREAIKVNHVINACQMDNGGCSHICYYNYITQQFTCTCPTHLVLDSSGKNCAAWTGSSEDDAVPVPSHAGYPEMPYKSTANPIQEPEFGVNYDHGIHQGVYNENGDHDGNLKFSSETEHDGHWNKQGNQEGHESNGEQAPEPTAEPVSNEKSLHGHMVHSSQDTGDSEAAPELTAELNRDNKYHDYSIHSGSESKDSSADTTGGQNFENHEPGRSVFMSKEQEPSAEPTIEPILEPSSETNPERRGHDHMYGFKDHEPAAEPTPEPAPEPNTEHDKDNHHVGSFAYGDKDNEPAAEPTSEPAPEPNTEHDKDNHHVGSFAYGDKDNEPAAEPTPEPAPEPNTEHDKDNHHVGSFAYGDKDNEPAAEPTPEPAPEPTGDHDKTHDQGGSFVYGDKAHKSAAEPTPEPAPEPNTEHNQDHHHDNSFANGDKAHEPTAEPTPEPAREPNAEREKNHNQDGSSYDHKAHEPAAEPTPEPAPEPTGEIDKAHDHDSSVYGDKNHEPTAEPAPEPTGENDKAHDHDSFAYGDKNHEPTAEPAPEPTGENVKAHDHDSSIYGDKNHEPTAEPAPEPTINENTNENNQRHGDHPISIEKDHKSMAEQVPESKPETAEVSNSDSKTQNHGSHPIYEADDNEPVSESTRGSVPEPASEHIPHEIIPHHDGSAVHKIKDHEPSAESTPEYSGERKTEGETRNLDGHTTYESKVHSPSAETASEHTIAEDSKGKDRDSVVDSLHEIKNFEIATEKIPELVLQGATNEHDSHSVQEFASGNKQDSQPETTQKSYIEPGIQSASGSPEIDSPSLENSKRIETSLPSATSAKDITSDSQPSLQNSNRELSSQENETKNSMKIHPTMQKESNEENKSGHHMPHLEDILIRKSNLNFETQNATGQNQNPLQNIELAANGEPVIEEIIINKSGRNSTDQTGLNPSDSVTSNESNLNFTKNAEGFNNQNIAVAGFSGDSSTKESVLMIEGQDDSNNSSIQPGIPTDHPKLIEYSEVQSTHKIENDKETGKTTFEQSGSSKNNYETTVRSNDQNLMHSSQDFSMENKNKVKDMIPEPGDKEYKLVNPSDRNIPVTTMHPEVQQEYHTIPVFVEAPSSGDSTPNLEKNPEIHEANIRERDMSAENFDMNLKNTGIPEPIENKHQNTNDTGDGKILKGEGDQAETQETSTEPHLTMTTLLSILTPEGIEKLSGHGQGAVMSEIQNENKTILKPNEEEINETTKSPEEISNNIKDELLDNEAFNTLLDKEYKSKEGISSEGKDIINKYPNKSLKTDKKKLKDYVKGEKSDSDKKGEVTARPGVTPEDFILQKHVNGNENIFDLDYSLQNDHTTKHDGGVTVIDPHGIPGVSFKPYGINNHDLSVLQTISPDFRTETIFPSEIQEYETLKPDSKIKLPENKEGDSKLDRDYKFDKDYKYEKQKVSKKKDLKKKIGGKDGKNVELDDGRKYFTEVTKDDWDISQEGRDVTETTVNPSIVKMTVQPETEVRNLPEFSHEEAVILGSDIEKESNGPETIFRSPHNFEIITETHGKGATKYPKLQSGDKQGVLDNLKLSEQSTAGPNVKDNEKSMKKTATDENGHLMIDEPTNKGTFNNVSPSRTETVYDGQLFDTVNPNNPQIVNTTMSFSNEPEKAGIAGTVFDGITQGTTVHSDEFGQGGPGQSTTYVVHKTTHLIPEIVSEGGVVNSTKAHPTINIHGQSGNIQDGHVRFSNSTPQNYGNATVMSTFNGTLSSPEGHSFTFTNYTSTFPNGSAVHPTIVVHGQSGTLQDGHKSRFGNSTFQTFTTFSTHSTDNGGSGNSHVYRIENSTLPGTVFDGNFTPKEGHYHMYTNSSGTFVYTNTSKQPIFRIQGQSGDFSNSTAYILENTTNNKFSGGFVGPDSVVFRNSTVFAVENTERSDGGVREITLEPHYMTSNDTIQFTHQMSPSFVSSGTAYKVNNYFGYISKCAAGQFQCVNGTSKRGSACINLSSKCDSINDCSDGSDELGCIEKGCPGNFQCSDSTCLKRNLVCNGILDCSDGSDEKNCESWKCEFDEFQCPSGRCIPVVWQCDNKPDCDNHTDEYNCQTSCGNDEYLCPEGWCIPLTYKCNGIKECTNGEDEQLCDCSHEEFKCQTGGCISMKQVCNGLDDCPDRSDEWDCVKLEPSSNLLKIRSPSGNYEPVCADNWSSQYSDQVCASLGYFSSVPIENENRSITTETSFYILKNDTTDDLNKKIIINLKKSEGNCSSGKLVEISCQEFSCGSRSMTDSSSVEARLVGGMSATAGQWPSVALLYNIRNFHSCTANVLTPRWVLASYNCLKLGNFRNKNLNEQDWKFYGGSTIFESERENAETRKILSIIPHPQVKFNQFLFTNDLALVELDQSLQFTSNLGAVCLPEQEMQPRQICVTAGWGMNTPEDKAIRQQLQYLPVPTMNLTECNSTEHYSGFITDDKICAGYNSAQKSLCYNEEGAPLMCVNDRGEWELQGVLSYHSNCGRGSHPSIFSSISPVTDWIKKTIGNNFERKVVAVTNR